MVVLSVWKRDGEQCAYVGHEGRCPERGWLELHHLFPFTDGGPATVANIELRCRSHNAYEASLYFESPPEDLESANSPRDEFA